MSENISSRFTSYSRIGGDERFRFIAQRSIELFGELHPKVDELRNLQSQILSSSDDPSDPPEEYYDAWERLHPIEEERDEACVIACVFTGLYFEAFIYDYAASCLGDKYVRDYLDKMDFISKWMVVPRLTVGKGLDKSAVAYQVLRRLHKDRNDLVHLKSREFSLDPVNVAEYLEKREKNILESVENCKISFKVIIGALSELDPEHPKLLLLSRELLDRKT